MKTGDTILEALARGQFDGLAAVAGDQNLELLLVEQGFFQFEKKFYIICQQFFLLGQNSPPSDKQTGRAVLVKND